MSFTQNLSQISSERNFLVSGLSPIRELNKPNQIFLQALNKGHIPQTWKKYSTVNVYFKLFYMFIYILFNFVHQLDCNTDELIFLTYPSHIHACICQ